jgi:hypothetical protein
MMEQLILFYFIYRLVERMMEQLRIGRIGRISIIPIQEISNSFLKFCYRNWTDFVEILNNILSDNLVKFFLR